jgi:predicted transcriptional regulator
MTPRETTQNVRSFFLNEKPYKALLYIQHREQLCAADIAEEIDTTYSHAVNIMNRMEQDYGLVTSKKKGRKVKYTITETGADICRYFEGLEEVFENRCHLDNWSRQAKRTTSNILNSKL